MTVKQGEVVAQSYNIFCQYRRKLAMTHTTAIKWKEEYDAVVVDCHLSLHLCGNRMKMSLPKKNFFRETPTSPWVPFRVKLRPIAQIFCPNHHLAYSICLVIDNSKPCRPKQ